MPWYVTGAVGSTTAAASVVSLRPKPRQSTLNLLSSRRKDDWKFQKSTNTLTRIPYPPNWLRVAFVLELLPDPKNVQGRRRAPGVKLIGKGCLSRVSGQFPMGLVTGILPKRLVHLNQRVLAKPASTDLQAAMPKSRRCAIRYSCVRSTFTRLQRAHSSCGFSM